MVFKKEILFKFTILDLSMCVERYRFKWGDGVILACLIFLALFIILCFNKSERNVEIRQNGELLYRLDLSDPQYENKKIEITGKYSCVLLIKNGEISVIESDCPDQICKHSASIGQRAGAICCVPNALIITSVENDGLDVIVK